MCRQLTLWYLCGNLKFCSNVGAIYFIGNWQPVQLWKRITHQYVVWACQPRVSIQLSNIHRLNDYTKFVIICHTYHEILASASFCTIKIHILRKKKAFSMHIFICLLGKEMRLFFNFIRSEHRYDSSLSYSMRPFRAKSHATIISISVKEAAIELRCH